MASPDTLQVPNERILEGLTVQDVVKLVLYAIGSLPTKESEKNLPLEAIVEYANFIRSDLEFPQELVLETLIKLSIEKGESFGEEGYRFSGEQVSELEEQFSGLKRIAMKKITDGMLNKLKP